MAHSCSTRPARSVVVAGLKQRGGLKGSRLLPASVREAASVEFPTAGIRAREQQAESAASRASARNRRAGSSPVQSGPDFEACSKGILPVVVEGTMPVVDGAGGQEGSTDLTAVSLTTDNDAASCFQTMQVEDILLVLAVGHSLPRSTSPLAALPREVMQHHLAPNVRHRFVDYLAERGLLTPVQAPSAPPSRPPPLVDVRRRGATNRTLGWDVSRRPLLNKISTWPSSASPSSDSGANEQGLLTHMMAATLWKFEEHAVTLQQTGTAASSILDELQCN